MCNYWLIPMDYQTCNYKQMQDEWGKNNVASTGDA